MKFIVQRIICIVNNYNSDINGETLNNFCWIMQVSDCNENNENNGENDQNNDGNNSM